MPVEMLLHGLGQAAPSGAPLVLLKESTGERYLVIETGPLEILGSAASHSGGATTRALSSGAART